jgi:uncharacterized phiE125 gp8 family phage protein
LQFVNRHQEAGMALIPLSAPALEPVTLAEAKLFARIDGSEEDLLIQALIVAARLRVEALTRRILVTQTWRYITSELSKAAVRIPLAPVQAVTGVRSVSADGTTTALAGTDWRGDLAGFPPSIRLQRCPQAGARLEIDLTLGYGAPAAVPAPLVQAVRLVFAESYENRGFLGMGGDAGPPPAAVLALLAPYRTTSL